MSDGLMLRYWQYGFLAPNRNSHPLRRIQAMIRTHGAASEAIEREQIISDIRADLDLYLEAVRQT